MPKGKHTSLYVTILTVFISVSVVIAGAVAGYNYYKDKRLAREMAGDLLSEVSDKVILESRRVFEPALSIVTLMDRFEGAAVKPALHSHPAAQLMMDSLVRFPQLFSIYLGFDDGDFYQVVSFRGLNGKARDALHAPRRAMFGIRTVHRMATYSPVDRATGRQLSVGHSRRMEMWVWLNGDRKIVGSHAVRESTYDPRVRPWYEMARTSSAPVMTDYYTFASSRTLGFTVAQRFDGQIAGVIGVDMTVQSISGFLRQQRAGAHGLVFIFTEDGKLTAYPDPDRVVRASEVNEGEVIPVFLSGFDDPVASGVFRLFSEDRGPDLRQMEVDGRQWLARYSLIPNPMGRGEYVAVAALLSDFTAGMERTRLESLAFACGVILCMMPVIVIIARHISRPLAALVGETVEIRHFRLDREVEIRSRIKEVAELASAFTTMKHTLGSFGRYLPRALVRQFVLSDMEPVLGGERRELSLLFTDVAGFTTMSEQMDAETLMFKVSDYFQELGLPVLQSSGTIDKFIGDAMMAFWNAPVAQEDHAIRACGAALQCRNVLAVMNHRWLETGGLPMPTRFGLHVGDCIVGNVGTSDRMNYTAMGANVNTAARLEGLNKYYGTVILASGAMQERTRNVFLFRSVDIACPKGALDAVHLFELLAPRPGHEQYGESVNDTELAWLDRWEKAIMEYRTRNFAAALELFTALQAKRPDDALAALYVERCRALVESPPAGDWSPVVVHATK